MRLYKADLHGSDQIVAAVKVYTFKYNRKISAMNDKAEVPGQFDELKRLKIKTRNQVRAILAAAELGDSINLLNRLRAKSPARELLQIDRVLRNPIIRTGPIVPQLFPDEPQTSEAYLRLERLPLAQQLAMVDGLVRENLFKLQRLARNFRSIGDDIIAGDLREASKRVQAIFEEFGFSHVLLRKAVLIRTLLGDEESQEVESLLVRAGLDRNNVIVTSLIHCYAEEQDLLNLKKSILNLARRGRSNQFTRDICRLPFHPLAKDSDDLAELIQSCLQSSLYDAVIATKVNIDLVTQALPVSSSLFSIFAKIDEEGPTIDAIASMYDSSDPEGEVNFYKHSSAWLENKDIVRYRLLQDHFYDAPESPYFKIDDNLISRIKTWAKPTKLEELVAPDDLTSHQFFRLKGLEKSGPITRSSLFNFCICTTNGYDHISEKNLVSVMGITRDLDKTINVNYARTLTKLADTKLSKLIFSLLIARKSKSERDDHLLRRILQQLAHDGHNGNLVALLDAVSARSVAIATYLYETCTEDFIAKLFHIVKTSSDITETRAALHKWMGGFTKDQAYVDRARTLLIDHQLNKVRNEIDDNRIYVDSARFSQWINDEITRDLNVILTALEHRNALGNGDDPQLVAIVERCYLSFCSNTIFGIASYLGRRIRHGTFKGHLYSTVVALERDPKYSALFLQNGFSSVWERWKAEYEEKIVTIIRDRLHIESSGKRDALLKPGLNNTAKQEIALLCAKYIAKDFVEAKAAKAQSAATQIFTEYCWRLAEYDLKNINVYIKNRKSDLVNGDLLAELRASTYSTYLAKDFCKDLVRTIDEKLMAMYTWFKRPANVSPRASLQLLYKAVVAEVRDTYPEFETSTDFEATDEIEIVGGTYHVLYDSLYVIVFNAAKHGKQKQDIDREFFFTVGSDGQSRQVTVKISSVIRDDQTEEYVISRLAVDEDDDLVDAQISEIRSGIRKLYHLAKTNKGFFIESITCENRKVTVTIALQLDFVDIRG